MARAGSSSKSKVAKGKKRTGANTRFKTKSDVAKAIFKRICEEHAVGMTEGSRTDLAAALGSGNPRTEKFAHGLKILLDEGDLQAGNKGMLELSGKGIAKIPKDVEPKTLAEIHEGYIKRLEATVSSGAKHVRELWEILEDRKTHTINEIASKLGFTNPRSFTNSKAIAIMGKMGLITKEGQNVTMTDKAFPSTLTD